MSWLWVCSRLAPPGGSDVLEQHAVDQPVVLLEVDQAIAVGPEDLADVLLGQGGHALVMLGALDDDLVGADAGHHVVDAVAPLVEAPLDLQRGEAVGHHADPPARSVGPRAEAAIGEDLRRRPILVPLAERAGGGRVRRRVLRAEVVGPLGPLVRDDHPAADDRVFPQVGHDSVSSTADRGSKMPKREEDTRNTRNAQKEERRRDSPGQVVGDPHADWKSGCPRTEFKHPMFACIFFVYFVYFVVKNLRICISNW